MRKLLKKIPKLKRRYWVGIVILLVVLGFFMMRSRSSEPLEFAGVSRHDVQEIVAASGVVTGRESASLHFLGSGRLVYLGVKVGDQVGKGRVVASLDGRDLSLSLQQAENSLRSAQASAEKALDDVKGHSADETFTQKETRTKAEVTRDSAYDAVTRARIALSQASMIAPIGGVVTQVNGLPGQFVSGADTIVQIVDFSQIYFDADIDEADVSRVAVGQPVRVEFNAYPEKEFSGTVDQIVPQTKTSASGATIVRVRIKMDNPGIVLVDGLNGQVEIVVRESKNVLSIPRDSLREDNKVLVRGGKSVKPIDVVLGVESDTDVEIVSGLTEGQEVVTNPSGYKQPSGGFRSFLGH